MFWLEVAAVFLVGILIGLCSYTIYAFMKKMEKMLEMRLYSPILVSVRLSSQSYPLFHIRQEMLGNRQPIIDCLIECRKEMKRGEFVYAALTQFYERLGYTAFNFFIITEIASLPNPKIQDPPVFCVGKLAFDDDTTVFQMRMELTSYFSI